MMCRSKTLDRYFSMKNLGLKGIICHDGLSKEFISKYETENIQFIYFEIDKKRPHSLNNLRFHLYLDLLEEGKLLEFTHVFMTDVSDVTVVKNPFSEISSNDHTLYIGHDEEGKVEENEWMMNLIRFCDKHLSESLKNTILRKEVLNAGVIGGHVTTIKNLLTQMVWYCDQIDPSINSDMLILNLVVWNFVPDISKHGLCYGEPVVSKFRKFETNRKDVWFIHK